MRRMPERRVMPAIPLDESQDLLRLRQACLDPLGVGNGKVSNRSEAASQEAVKLFQSFIAETLETTERVHYLRCIEG